MSQPWFQRRSPAGAGPRLQAAPSGRTAGRTPDPGTLVPVSTRENPFGQVLVALVTPFTADGEVDWPGVEQHIDDCITAGATASS